MLAAFAAVATVTILGAVFAGVLLTADDERARIRPIAPPAARRKLHAGARVLFCDGDDTTVTVDCALISVDPPRADLPAGIPFAVRLRTPKTVWFEQVTLALLSSWARDERVIELEVTGDGTHAALDDGATRFCLELEVLSGLTPVPL